MTQTQVARTTGARPTDDQLLDAARDVFADRGFHASSMAEIAEQANSTKPTLYAHFGGKDELYARVLLREANQCRTHLFDAYEAAATLGLRDQTRADVEALFTYVEEQPQGFELLFGPRNAGSAAGVRTTLLDDIASHLAQRLMDYRTGSVASAPTWSEQQLAPMLVGSAITAAQHARAVGADMPRASALASAFAIAALESISSR